MAEALLGVVTEEVLSKVISLASERISRVLGVKKDLESLAKKLELIQALLSDAASKSTPSDTINAWLKQLADAAAEADDLLDEFSYEVLSKKMLKERKDKVCSFFFTSNPLFFRFKTASNIKKTKLLFEEIFQNANQIGLVPSQIINSPIDSPRKVLSPTNPFVDDSKIVGRGDDVRKIVSRLTYSTSTDEEDLSVIGIVGMPGQGKTALSQLLMKNDEVKKHFEKRIWTCVSDDFNVDRVLKDMLQSLTGEASQLTNNKAIVNCLSKELQGKIFLLVLDDVWNENSQLWDCMNNCLQAIGGAKGSKIIVTTRSEVVVTIMNGFVYPLGVLSRKASQELFEKIAFGSGRVAKTPQLVEIGERIVPRCGGLPLALKAIGGLMSSQREELEWLKIEESNIWCTLDGVHSAIKLSFDHLPSLSLKQCFTFCSIFPKDSDLVKKDLIQQWMALGLLNPSKESDLEMEQVGNNYFKILLQRSFLQEAEFDEYGNIKSSKMHDLLHDFALEASKGLCLAARVGRLTDYNRPVHLSLFLDGTDISNISEKIFSRLRTLHLNCSSSSRDLLFLRKCKHLRVLTVNSWSMEELPISVAKMKHLRYLDISNTRVCALPEFISELYNLQTLRLPFVTSLPERFGGLINLRHLLVYLPYYDHQHHLVPGISKLTYLHTLNCFPVSRDKRSRIEALCNLNHLEGRLRITGLENVANGDEAKRANLSQKRNIESLELLWCDADTEGSNNHESVLEDLQPHPCLKSLNIRYFKGTRLPSWISGLHNLTCMKLAHLVNCEQVAPLGHLPVLKDLYIGNMDRVKYVGNDFYGCQYSSAAPVALVFPSLKKLVFENMFSLEEWPDISSSVELFPCLEDLIISSCPRLTHLPAGLSVCKSLASLHFAGCHKLASIPDLSNLHSLKELSLPILSTLPYGNVACNSLESLYVTGPASLMESLPHFLTNLRELNLTLSDDCIDPYISMLEDDVRGHDDHCSTLQGLCLFGMPELKSLPDQIQHLTALRKLYLILFEGLEILPEWLGNLHSLENLLISGCHSLREFPSVEAMRGLTNLKSLEMQSCPILEPRCDRETGAEWPKIAHIPKLYL